MNVKIERRPALLYETVELLRAYVNQIPSAQLTMEGAYCIPPKAVAYIQQEACKGLDPQEPLLNRFFVRRAILGAENQFTSLASCMVYSLITLEPLDLHGQIQALCRGWASVRRKPLLMKGINRFALDLEPAADSSATLATELKKLPIEEDFVLTLLEAFSDYDYQMAQLEQLIAPVADRLALLLAPYVEKAEALAETWEEFFQEQPVEAFIEKRMGTKLEQPLEKTTFVLRYLDSRYSPGRIAPGANQNQMTTHLGVGTVPTLQPSYETTGLNAREVEALRLMGDQGRSEIIQLLMGRSMSMQEVALTLDMNRGTAFRNLNNLTNAELLTKEIQGERYFYRTNFAYIQAIFQHFLEFYQTGSTILPG